MYIVEQNYDYFHSMYESEGMTEQDEVPKLNPDGKVFYLFFGLLPSTPTYTVSSMGLHVCCGGQGVGGEKFVVLQSPARMMKPSPSIER